MWIKNILLFASIIFFLQSCTEEFFLDSINSKQLLVVDGIITNEPGPYTIKLSQSAKTNKPQFIPLSNCIVSLYDNTGSSEVLTESLPGQYTTSEGGFQGTIGNEYRLTIITEDGKEYETGFQKMKELIEIDSLYSKLTYKNDIEYPFGLPGYEFYVDTEVAIGNDNYFLWNMIETYQYDITYELEYIETAFENIYYNPRYDTLQTCWNTEKVKTFYTGKTTNLSLAQITNKPLHFVSTESKKLTIRYSALINQFIINEEAYNYWEKIESQTTNDNFLTTNQPYDITGNLKNTNDPDEVVLGYFTVASISQKRLFVDRPRAPFHYPLCVVIIDQVAIDDYKMVHSPPYFWVKDMNNTLGLINKKCLDCRFEDGELNRPEFWID